jgi:hypothetical protein
MSFEPDNIDHDLSVEDLLLAILNELRIIKTHQEQITGEIIKQEDVNED